MDRLEGIVYSDLEASDKLWEDVDSAGSGYDLCMSAVDGRFPPQQQTRTLA